VSFRVTYPERVPVDDGVNVIVIVQFDPTGSVPPQVVVWE